MTDSTTDRPQDTNQAATDTSQAATPATQADGLNDWATAFAQEDATAQTATQTTAPTAPLGDKSLSPLLQPLSGNAASQNADIDLIMNVPVQLTVELGRTRMAIKNLLQLGQGSVVELDGLAGEPMDIYVNGYLIAQGEVVVVEDRYGIRVTDIITPSERINRLNNRR